MCMKLLINSLVDVVNVLVIWLEVVVHCKKERGLIPNVHQCCCWRPKTDSSESAPHLPSNAAVFSQYTEEPCRDSERVVS